MTFPVAETLGKYGLHRVAAASGIPFWTLRKWYDADIIPGKGVAREMRVACVVNAIKKLKPLPEAERRPRAKSGAKKWKAA